MFHPQTMKNILIIQLLFCTICYSQKWELKKNKDHIKIYVRDLDSTKIHEYKAVMNVKSSEKKAVEVITNGDSLWTWNYKTSESKLIKTISEHQFIFWIKNNFTWPVTNRDHVSLVTVKKDKGRTYIYLEPGPSQLVPEKDNCIRVTNFKGFWKIETIDNDTIEITQQMYGDPNGNIPVWALNSVLATYPYHSFLNLREILEN